MTDRQDNGSSRQKNRNDQFLSAEQKIMIEAQEQMNLHEQDYNYAKVSGQIKEIQFQLKGHDTNFKRMQKQIDSRPTQSTLIQTIALINAGIHTDPNIIKLLKTKESKEQDEKNKLKYNSLLFSKKLNQMCESLSVLMDYIKRVDRKTTTIEMELTSSINQKSSFIQQQLDDFKADQVKENLLVNEKLQISLAQSSDKIRDIETKTGWKINQFKTKLQQKINQEKVIEMIEAAGKKFNQQMKEYQLQSNIDPNRIIQIQTDISNNRINAANGITELNYKLSQITNQMEDTLLKKQLFFDNKIDIQRRLNLLNKNFSQIYDRVGNCESEEREMNKKINQLLKDTEISFSQVSRINTVLLNLKIGQDFQRMLQEMDPTKVLELQDTVDGVKLDQMNIFKEIQYAKRQIDKINARAQIAGILIPNKPRQKMKKEELNQALNDFLIQNQFARKINLIENQLSQAKASNQAIVDLNRKVARLQKQNQYQNVIFEIRNLQQYVKKQVSLLQSKINQNKPISSLDQIFKMQRPLSSDKKRNDAAQSGNKKRIKIIDSISLSKLALTDRKILNQKLDKV